MLVVASRLGGRLRAPPGGTPRPPRGNTAPSIAANGTSSANDRSTEPRPRRDLGRRPRRGLPPDHDRRREQRARDAQRGRPLQRRQRVRAGTRHVFAANTRSHVIDLPGTRRNITASSSATATSLEAAARKQSSGPSSEFFSTGKGWTRHESQGHRQSVGGGVRPCGRRRARRPLRRVRHQSPGRGDTRRGSRTNSRDVRARIRANIDGLHVENFSRTGLGDSAWPSPGTSGLWLLSRAGFADPVSARLLGQKLPLLRLHNLPLPQ